MKNNYCYRCLMSFDRHSRIIEHLSKKKRCLINNPKYDIKYDQKIMSLFNQQGFDIESDFNQNVIQITEDQKICYQCQLCKHKSPNKAIISRHLMNVCMCQKYIIKNELLNLMNKSSTVKKKTKSKMMSETDLIYEHITNEIKEMGAKLNEKLNSFDRDLSNIKNKPTNINNFQVLCLDSNQNSLDLLIEKYGDFNRAIEFIKGCALSNISGDVRLIEKIYLESKHPAFWYLDKKRHKMGWIDENGHKLVDIGGKLVMRKLANSLQSGYLKGVTYLVQKNLDNRHTNKQFLEDYDIQAWNDHIYNLRDEKYQAKLLSCLDIGHQSPET